MCQKYAKYASVFETHLRFGINLNVQECVKLGLKTGLRYPRLTMNFILIVQNSLLFRLYPMVKVCLLGLFEKSNLASTSQNSKAIQYQGRRFKTL